MIPPGTPLTGADVLSLAETAELLGMPRSTITDLARRGGLPAVNGVGEYLARRRWADGRGRPRAAGWCAARDPVVRRSWRLSPGRERHRDRVRG